MSNIDGKPFTEILKLAAIGEAVVMAVRESELLKPKPRRRARQARVVESGFAQLGAQQTAMKRRPGRTLAQVPDEPDDGNNAA